MCRRTRLPEFELARGEHPALDRLVATLLREFGDQADLESRARSLVDRMALALQASLLLRHAPAYVSGAFCRSRLESVGSHQDTTLPPDSDLARIIERSLPGHR